MATRVLHIVSSPQPSVLRQLALVAAGLAQRGFAFRTIVLTALAQERHAPLDPSAVDLSAFAPPALESRRLSVWPAFDPRGLQALRELVDEFDPHVVHAHGSRAAGDACWVCRGRPLVVETTSGDDAASWWDRFMLRRAAARAAEIVARIESERQQLPAALQANVQVIPPGIAASSPAPEARGALLEELNLPRDTRLIGCAGPLTSAARLKDLIWAADLLKCVRDDVHLLVLGNGPQRWRLERYRRQVEITDRVHFLGSRADEAVLLGALDCFWQSAGNRLNLPLLEAMSAGVPVVSADTRMNRELITPEENGVLVPLGDRASFARRTQVLLDDVSLARRLGDAGRASIGERFPPGRTIEQWATLYQRIVERNSFRSVRQ